jgi:hypothetical protein
VRALFRYRQLWLGAVVAIMVVVSLAQGLISYTLTFGVLRDFLPVGVSPLATILFILRFALVAAMAVLWLVKRNHALFRLIIISNVLFTVTLMTNTIGLIAVLFGSVSEAINVLMLDVTLMAVSNILIFSVWYWIIDPPGVEEIARVDEPWEFLFPQRGSSLPHYESWVPHYVDYLFVAFTTSFAFSPTDTLPLTRRAKMLMLLQAAISVVTLTGIAGSAINILAGGK